MGKACIAQVSGAPVLLGSSTAFGTGYGQLAAVSGDFVMVFTSHADRHQWSVLSLEQSSAVFFFV